MTQPLFLYRLVLTLTPLCGPRACPQVSPPFLEGNRKYLVILFARFTG